MRPGVWLPLLLLFLPNGAFAHPGHGGPPNHQHTMPIVMVWNGSTVVWIGSNDRCPETDFAAALTPLWLEGFDTATVLVFNTSYPMVDPAFDFGYLLRPWPRLPGHRATVLWAPSLKFAFPLLDEAPPTMLVEFFPSCPGDALPTCVQAPPPPCSCYCQAAPAEEGWFTFRNVVLYFASVLLVGMLLFLGLKRPTTTLQ